MTKETARAITQLVPKYDQMMIMGSSIKNAIAHLKLYKLNDEEIKLIITACVVQGLNRPVCTMSMSVSARKY